MLPSLPSRCLKTVLLVLALLSFHSAFTKPSHGQAPQPDLILTGGNVYTVDAAKPTAQAIAILKDRIIAVGTNEEIKNLIGDETRVIDLDGKFVMPGFIEGHAHFVGLGESMMMLKLQKSKNWDDIVEQVREAAKVTPPGEWIIGRGWHQSKWDKTPEGAVEGYPTAAEIDKVSPDNPVLLTHASGHMSFANGYAMQMAGVTPKTENPSGGEILKSESGAPIGIFREKAASLIQRRYQRDMAKRSMNEKLDYTARAIELASQECLSKGITSFQDAGSTLETVVSLKDFAARGKLGVRLWVMIRDSNERMAGRLSRYKMIGYGNEFLTVRALKRSIDGALGPHGAWLLGPYEDLPTSSGLNTASVESVTETARMAIENDFQMCVHAIGDRANREVLDIFEKLFKTNPSNIPRRWRIEHAQHLHPDDIPRFGKMGVIASMQAVHCTSDAVFVPKRLGMRRSKEGAYVWKSLMNSGAVVTNGTDAPVEDVDPLASYFASVTRELKPGITFFPEQAMTREEAIRSYTIDAAYSAFEETSKGSLVPGKLADIVVLSKDLINCPSEEIKQTKVEMTIVGGKVAYSATDQKTK
ncbi:MAG: amidohydrolase [Mariniblastus sp.]